MRKLIYGLLLGLTALFCGLIWTTTPVQAAAINVTGLGGGDAKVTTTDGQNVTGQSEYDRYQNYQVDYTWAIPDTETLTAGSTAPVTLPDGLIASSDTTIPIMANGVEIGTFTIKKGETTGTMTFNGLGADMHDRNGTLTFATSGTYQKQPDGNTWNVNKIGWISGQDADGTPNLITWNVAFNSGSLPMGPVTITDTIGPNQTYVPGSVHAVAGAYDAGGAFHGNGTQLSPSVSQDGNQLTFDFGNVSTAVDMTYQTKPTITGGMQTWSNSATLNGQTVNANVSYGGNGTGTGQGYGSVVLTKYSTQGGQPLAGATYQVIQDNGTAAGNVLIEAAVTDANGQITLNKLLPGNYRLVEVSAPAGYTVDPTPITFTIDENSTTVGQLTAVNQPEAPTTPVPDEDGTIVINKLGIDNAALAGAVFNLVNDQQQIVASDLTTDAQGEVTIPNVPAGNYTLVETAAPAGYELAQPVPVTVSKQGGTQIVTITDQKTPVTNPGNPGGDGSVTPPVGEPGDNNGGNPTGPETPGGNPGGGNPTNPENPGGNGTNPENPSGSTPNPEQPTVPGNGGQGSHGNPSTTPGQGSTGNQSGTSNGNAAVTTPAAGSSSATGDVPVAAANATGNGQSTTTGKLPQTSEHRSPWLMILGTFGLVATIGWLGHRRND